MPADTPMVLVPREELRRLNWIIPYLDWTIGDESPGHHPTMPSAVGAFKHRLATLLSASPVGEGASASPIPTEQAGGPVVVGPGGWLVKDFADGWYWTGDRLNADMAANGGACVYRIDGGEYETATPPTSTAEQVGMSEASASKIGDTRVMNGRVWRLYEIELEGEKWMDIGPAPTMPADTPMVLADQRLIEKLDAQDWRGIESTVFRLNKEQATKLKASLSAPSTTSTAEQAGEGDAPVAWRWRLNGYDRWVYADGPRAPMFSTVQPGEVYAIQPLHTRPTPATPEGLRELCAVLQARLDLAGRVNAEAEYTVSEDEMRAILAALQPQAQPAAPESEG